MLPTPYPAHNPSLTEPFPALGPTMIQNRHLHMPAELGEVQRPSMPRDAARLRLHTQVDPPLRFEALQSEDLSSFVLTDMSKKERERNRKRGRESCFQTASH